MPRGRRGGCLRRGGPAHRGARACRNSSEGVAGRAKALRWQRGAGKEAGGEGGPARRAPRVNGVGAAARPGQDGGRRRPRRSCQHTARSSSWTDSHTGMQGGARTLAQGGRAEGGGGGAAGAVGVQRQAVPLGKWSARWEDERRGPAGRRQGGGAARNGVARAGGGGPRRPRARAAPRAPRLTPRGRPAPAGAGPPQGAAPLPNTLRTPDSRRDPKPPPALSWLSAALAAASALACAQP
jgi:hypothetical protein